MRSMYVSMLALALTVLLCACVSNVPVWRGSADVLCLRCGAELLGAGRLV